MRKLFGVIDSDSIYINEYIKRYKPTSQYCGMLPKFCLFVYTSFCLCRLRLLLYLTLWSLSIFIPPTVHPATQCAPDSFHLYFYLCNHVCIYTRVHHIIPRLAPFPLDVFLPLFHSIFIYTYLATSLILLLAKLSFFVLWCTKPLPIPPCHLLFSL